MSSRLKSLAGQSFIYGLSGIITRMITIFLVPIYTRIFNPADYGQMNLINTTFGLAAMFIVLGLDSAVGRFYYDHQDENYRKSIFSTWFWSYLVLAIIGCLLLMCATPIAAKFIFNQPISPSFKIWVIPCLTLIVNIVPSMIWNYFRLQLKPVHTTIFTLSQSLLTVGLTIYFVVFLKLGIIGVYYALFLSGFVYSLVGLYFLFKWINIKYYDKQLLKSMLKYSLPLIPAALSFWMINTTDSYFILMFRPISEVGLFAIGASLAAGASLVTGAFQQALGPFVFSIKDEPNAKQTYKNIFIAFSIISGCLILGIFLFSSELLMLLTTPKYYSADWVASILSINIVLMSFTYIASIGTNIMKDNKPYAIAVIAGSVLVCILNLLLIPYLGKEGSAIATVFSQIFVVGYIFNKAEKMFFVGFDFRTGVIIILSAILIGVFAKLFINETLIINIGIKILLLIGYTAFIFFIFKKQLKTISLKNQVTD